MSITQSLISFTLAVGLLTMTPGLDTALVLRGATVASTRQASLAAIGVIIGCLIWGGSAAIGLGALLQASPVAFACLKWGGVVYLVWLGIQLIARPRREFAQGSASDATKGNWLHRGLAQNLLNPKVGIFYVSFLPQFLPAHVPVVAYSLLLALIHAVLGSIWFALLISAIRPVAGFLRRPGVVGWLDRLCGAVFVGFGLRLALAHR